MKDELIKKVAEIDCIMPVEALHDALRVDLSRFKVCDSFWLKLTVSELFQDRGIYRRGAFLERTTHVVFLVCDGKLVQYISTELPGGWHHNLLEYRFRCLDEPFRPVGVLIE